jgi:ferredoxin-NADP reductase/MOSC domain-containing protein YiiM/ferredoxin
MPRLISVNVGLPREVAWRGATVRTAIWKQPVPGRRVVRRLNLDGDGQGDLAGHGGEQRAVMVYQIDSYQYWEAHLRRNDFSFGQFGENFSVEGLSDSEVCIGDRYRIGSAVFEVTQPRVTCYRVGIRMDEPQMAALLVAHHRPGFYFRVIQEGEVGSGDEIVKVAAGEERMTVAEVDGLLYLPGRSRNLLERALRIPSLSSGWTSSFQALLDQDAKGSLGTGNPGLTEAAGPPPAWSGFRSLRVSRVDRETTNVVSLFLEAPDRQPLPNALPGQFLVVKLRPKPELPPVLRNYSISSAPDGGFYRISVKREDNGVASSFLHRQIKVGDSVEASAPRGNFTLQHGTDPVVFLSAGIGATPVLAMLHALSSTRSRREVWWLYGARNREEHPFARESRELLSALTNARRHIMYSRPRQWDRIGGEFDAVGHLSVPVLDQLGVPREADFHLCGPASFLSSFTAGLPYWGVKPQRIHSEIFGPGASSAPGVVTAAMYTEAPQGGPGTGPQVSFVRSRVITSWSRQFQSLLELAEACHVPVKWSCRTGVCHSCESGLIGGVIDYQPDPLEPPAEGNVLICCSRPRIDVEIDL